MATVLKGFYLAGRLARPRSLKGPVVRGKLLGAQQFDRPDNILIEMRLLNGQIDSYDGVTV